MRARRILLRAAMRVPKRLRAALTGPAPHNDRGVALDADTWTLLFLAAKLGDPEPEGPVEARRWMRRGVTAVQGRAREVEVRDETLAGRPARRYRPPGAPVATLLYLHGGGWVTGDLDTHDRLCRRLVDETGWELVALDYRLAPEHAFPAGLDDALAAWRALAGPRVAIGGDSAGGNLAAAVCQVLRDAGEAVPLAQVLIYPGLDMRMQAPSIDRFAEGFMLEKERMEWYRAHYAVPDPLDPRASPGLHASLAGLPPAIVTTAGFDPLRDEGEAYVAGLRAAGVAVTHLEAATLIHGYATMDGALPAADREVGRIAAAMRALGA